MQTQRDTFTKVKRVVTDLVPVGLWLVSFEPIYSNRCSPGQHDDCLQHGCFDNGDEYVSDVDSTVAKVTRDGYRELPESVDGRDASWNDDAKACGDTHDLRPRLFKTKREAQAHAEYVVKRFRNPQPWECFVITR